jgi:hypothetical protein
MRGCVTICGASDHAAAPTAKNAPTMNRVSTAATLSICARSSATYTTGARVRINPTTISIPIAIHSGSPPNRYVVSVAELVTHPGHRLAK